MAKSNELSSRESEVVKLLLEGKSNKLIASSLSISERTVEFHLKNIYAKYQVSSRTELILKLGNPTGAGKPVDSTVAVQGEVEDNGTRSSLSNWSTSLRATGSTILKELNMNTVMNSTAHSEGNRMSFFESIMVCLRKFAEFNGRASRPEFWWFTLFITLLTSALAYMNNTLSAVFLIAMLLPLLAAGARRLHDSGRSGWWQLFLLVPVGGIVLLGFLWALAPTSLPSDDALPE